MQVSTSFRGVDINSDLIAESRPIQCYKKLPQQADDEAKLKFCGMSDDICVYADLTHEDGEY